MYIDIQLFLHVLFMVRSVKIETLTSKAFLYFKELSLLKLAVNRLIRITVIPDASVLVAYRINDLDRLLGYFKLIGIFLCFVSHFCFRHFSGI